MARKRTYASAHAALELGHESRQTRVLFTMAALLNGLGLRRSVRLNRAKVSLLTRHTPASLRGLAVFLYKLWPLSRMLAYRFAMVVRPCDRTAGEYAVWGEIWQRRHEWQQGFEQKCR